MLVVPELEHELELLQQTTANRKVGTEVAAIGSYIFCSPIVIVQKHKEELTETRSLLVFLCKGGVQHFNNSSATPLCRKSGSCDKNETN